MLSPPIFEQPPRDDRLPPFPPFLSLLPPYTFFEEKEEGEREEEREEKRKSKPAPIFNDRGRRGRKKDNRAENGPLLFRIPWTGDNDRGSRVTAVNP